MLFSGDVFSPSELSTIYKGEQMLETINQFDVHVSTIGNHDFDFGIEKLRDLISRTNIVWVLSNIKLNGEPAAGIESYVVDWCGVRIGFLGLAEKDWFNYIHDFFIPESEYEGYIECSNRLIPELHEKGCELIIALTHMRKPQDVKLAKEVEGIDLVLGGHDHLSDECYIRNCPLVKSGSDFRELSKINVSSEVGTKGRHGWRYTLDRCFTVIDYDPDPVIEEIVDRYKKQIDDKAGFILFEAVEGFEARFNIVRRSETAIGNFLIDVARHYTHADIGILHSGTIRYDNEHPPGPFTMKDFNSMQPMNDVLVSMKITGEILLKALINGYSRYPALEGRFPIPSGFTVKVHVNLPPAERVKQEDVIVNGEPLDLEREYVLVCKEFLARGGDDYVSLKQGKRVHSESAEITFKNCLISFFLDDPVIELPSVENLSAPEDKVRKLRFIKDGRIQLIEE